MRNVQLHGYLPLDQYFEKLFSTDVEEALYSCACIKDLIRKTEEYKALDEILETFDVRLLDSIVMIGLLRNLHTLKTVVPNWYKLYMDVEYYLIVRGYNTKKALRGLPYIV